MVPRWESFAEVSSSNTGPENRKVWAMERGVQSYLMVSMMIRSYIMMMILGRLLRMNISAIMMRTSDSLCSLALSDYYLSFLLNFKTDLDLIILFLSFLPESSGRLISCRIRLRFMQKWNEK